MTLQEFLLARIAEDANLAVNVEVTVPMGYSWRTINWMHGANRAHGQRWDPKHVLAECEAKRRIIAMIDGSDDFRNAMVRDGFQPYHSPSLDVLIMVQMLLALPYADHPDYREEWRLSGTRML